jgi:hypothetical protein
MAKPSSDLSFRAFLKTLPKEVFLGLLRAFGILPLRAGYRSGTYWARDAQGRWELRVPAMSLDEEPPVA